MSRRVANSSHIVISAVFLSLTSTASLRADDAPVPRPSLSAPSVTAPSAAELERPPVDFKKPLGYSLSLMSVGLPMLIAADAFESGPSFHNFASAYQSAPEWDNDSVFFNFVLHPLWGSETYLRAREANFGVPGSIAFSMGMSVTWEYLFESWVTHPSATDLVCTTGIGWMIGELRYKLKHKTDDRWDWALDPIHTTLEHLHIGVKRDKKGESETTVALTWDF